MASKTENKAEKRARNWFLVYNGTNMPTIKEIQDNPIFKKAIYYAYIIHDKDVDENGEPKRTHLHALVKFKEAYTFSQIKKYLEEWHIEICEKIELAVQYLIHKNDPNKAQYNKDQIITNDIDKTNKYISDDYINDEKVLMLELIQRKYESLFDVLMSGKYSMDWVQRRKSSIDTIILGLRQREERQRLEDGAKQIQERKEKQENEDTSTN